MRGTAGAVAVAAVNWAPELHLHLHLAAEYPGLQAAENSMAGREFGLQRLHHGCEHPCRKRPARRGVAWRCDGRSGVVHSVAEIWPPACFLETHGDAAGPALAARCLHDDDRAGTDPGRSRVQAAVGGEDSSEASLDSASAMGKKVSCVSETSNGSKPSVRDRSGLKTEDCALYSPWDP